MICFSTNSEDDATTVAIERSKDGLWYGVFMLLGSPLYTVHRMIYPSARGARKIVTARNGKLEEG